jgi:hypothetical protein
MMVFGPGKAGLEWSYLTFSFDLIWRKASLLAQPNALILLKRWGGLTASIALHHKEREDTKS